MDINSLYDIARFFLGEIPAQYDFCYMLFAFVLGIVFIAAICCPIVFAYKFLGMWK